MISKSNMYTVPPRTAATSAFVSLTYIALSTQHKMVFKQRTERREKKLKNKTQKTNEKDIRFHAWWEEIIKVKINI